MGELYLRHLSFADVFVNSRPTWIMVLSSCLGRLQLLMAWGYVSSREVQSIALPSFTGIPDFCNNQFACEHFVSPWSLFIEPPENGFPALVLEPRTKTPPILNFPLANVLHLSSFVFSALWRSYFWPKPPNQVRHVATSHSSQVALLSVMQYMFFWCCFVLQMLAGESTCICFLTREFQTSRPTQRPPGWFFSENWRVGYWVVVAGDRIERPGHRSPSCKWLYFGWTGKAHHQNCMQQEIGVQFSFFLIAITW